MISETYEFLIKRTKDRQKNRVIKIFISCIDSNYFFELFESSFYHAHSIMLDSILDVPIDIGSNQVKNWLDKIKSYLNTYILAWLKITISLYFWCKAIKNLKLNSLRDQEGLSLLTFSVINSWFKLRFMVVTLFNLLATF